MWTRFNRRVFAADYGAGMASKILARSVRLPVRGAIRGVITAAFKGARGIGTMTGFGDGPVGSPVQLTFNLRVVLPR